MKLIPVLYNVMLFPRLTKEEYFLAKISFFVCYFTWYKVVEVIFSECIVRIVSHITLIYVYAAYTYYSSILYIRQLSMLTCVVVLHKPARVGTSMSISKLLRDPSGCNRVDWFPCANKSRRYIYCIHYSLLHTLSSLSLWMTSQETWENKKITSASLKFHPHECIIISTFLDDVTWLCWSPLSDFYRRRGRVMG